MTRSHVIAWRDDLVQRALSGQGVKRPPLKSYEGKTPALGDHHARALLDAPAEASIKDKCDRSRTLKL